MERTDSDLFSPAEPTRTPPLEASKPASGETTGSRFWPKLTRTRVRKGLAIVATLISLMVTAWVFLTLNRRFFYNHIDYDEEFFVWGGWSITKGLVPYRDFLEFKPPMVFITHALAIALFGVKDQQYRIFFTIYPLASILLLQSSLIARGINRFLSMATLLGLISLFVNHTYHDTALSDCESIGLANYMFGFAFFLWQGRYSKVTLALGGAFMSACVLCKEPFAPVVVATWLGMFWLRVDGRTTFENAKFFAKYSLMGVGTFILTLLAYMVPTGAIGPYIQLMKDYARIYRDPQTSYCVALGIAHPSTPWNDALVAWGKIRTSFLNEAILGYLAPLAIPGAIFAYRRSPMLFVTMVLAAAGGLWAATATNCMWIHYYNMSMAGIIFILVAGIDSMKGALRSAHPAIRWGTSIAAVLFIAMHMYPTVEKERTAVFQRLPWREPMPGLLAFIQEHTTPTDRIFTSGPPVLYPQADRISAVRESNIIDEILPSYEGSTDEERLRHIYQQLVRNKPKVVFLDPEHGYRKGRHNRTLLMPYLAEFKYKKINEYLYLRP